MTTDTTPAAQGAQHTLLQRAAGLVSAGRFADAVALLAGTSSTDARWLYSLGICQFAAGQLELGVANVVGGLSRNPGLIPYWSLDSIVDPLTSLELALQEHAPASCPAAVMLSIRQVIAEGSFQRGHDSTAALVDIIRQLRPVDRLSAAAPYGQAEVEAMVAPQPVWHSMDLGSSFIQGRRKTARILASELLRLDLPDLVGTSVLDIGAFDGFFSFECERRGASQVTALDFHSWVVDLAEAGRYASDHRERHGVSPDLYAPPAELRHLEALPGRRAFDVARRLLRSEVRAVCRDFRTVEAAELGQFDVTLFLGVLYHLTDPFGALVTVHDLTRNVAVIETLGIHEPAATDRPLWGFYKDDRINRDPTTWWAPNECGLRDMLEAVGFARVEIKSGVSALGLSALGKPGATRIIAHAWK